MKKKSKAGIILVSVFFIGLSVLLYPSLADFWNQVNVTHVVDNYVEAVEKIKDYSKYFEAADTYNTNLANLSAPFYDYEKAGDYENTLNISGDGVIGYINISRLNVELPIYHGTGPDVLNSAVGHIEGTSFPVGGESTHAALSAHRGLPSAKLFTDLDKMEAGDTFIITVLDRTLTYEVDQIRIVLPEDLDEINIVDGEDYCTLVTCTPYGLNTHRLLVRGTRIENERTPLYVTTQAYRIDSLLAAPAVAAPMLLILLIHLMVRYNKNNVRRIKIEEIEYEEYEE